MRTLVALLIVAAAAALAVSSATAGMRVITFKARVDHVEARVGEVRPAALRVTDITEPGLGGWTFDVRYDPDVISVIDCAAALGGVCNPAAGPGTVRIVGASANGVTEDTTLAVIAFECSAAGTSAITLGFLDHNATLQNISEPTLLDSTITCTEPVSTAPAPTPSPASAPAPALPATGTGTRADPSMRAALLALLIGGAAVACLAGMRRLRN